MYNSQKLNLRSDPFFFSFRMSLVRSCGLLCEFRALLRSSPLKPVRTHGCTYRSHGSCRVPTSALISCAGPPICDDEQTPGPALLGTP